MVRNGSSAKSHCGPHRHRRPSWRWLATTSLAEAVEVVDGLTTGHMNESICSPKSVDDIISFMWPMVRLDHVNEKDHVNV